MRTTIDGLDIMGDPSVDRHHHRRAVCGDRCRRYGFAPEDLLYCKTRSANARRADEARLRAANGSSRRIARRWRLSAGRSIPRRPTLLMDFYRKGRDGSDFEHGIESALQFILASPEFLFRLEPIRRPKSPARTACTSSSDLALASRLSFFLWSSLPDETLIDAGDPGEAEGARGARTAGQAHAGRPAIGTLIANFAEQWLHLRNLKNSNPDLQAFPDFDDNLRQAMKEETTLLFDSIMREDRSVMDLLNADYTFVNERLARHYGIPNIYGSQFRRVHGAERSAPRTARSGQHPDGDVVSEPDVAGRARQMGADESAGRSAAAAAAERPAAARKSGQDGKVLPLRERMEEHRAGSGLCRLPHGDGPDRVRARELRRHRPLADHRRGSADRSPRARCSMARPSTASSGLRREIAQASGSLCRRHDGKDADLRRRAAASSTTTCLPCGRSCRTRAASNYRFSDVVARRRQERAVPDEGDQMRFITKKHLSRRTFLHGVGVDDVAAAARSRWCRRRRHWRRRRPIRRSVSASASFRTAR